MANGTEEERLRPLRYAVLCLIFVSMFVFFVLRVTVTGKVVLVWVTRVDFPVSMV